MEINGIIDVALSSDVEQLAAMQQAMAMESEGLALDMDTLVRGVGELVSNPARGTYYVVREGERIVGCMMTTSEWSDWNAAEYWWIQSVYVLPGYRRKGVFTALVENLERIARERGVKELRLYVDSTNGEAMKCYDKIGFSESHYRLREKHLSL